jgi:hypothetical protein
VGRATRLNPRTGTRELAGPPGRVTGGLTADASARRGEVAGLNFRERQVANPIGSGLVASLARPGQPVIKQAHIALD